MPKRRPKASSCLPGKYYNEYLPGHVIGMPPPLADGAIAYDGETARPETVDQYATTSRPS